MGLSRLMRNPVDEQRAAIGVDSSGSCARPWPTTAALPAADPADGSSGAARENPRRRRRRPDMTQTDLGHHPFEAGTQRAAGRRPAEVLVDHLDLGPAKLRETIAHGVLQRPSLAIVCHLMSRRLAHVQRCLACPMLDPNLLSTHRRRSSVAGSGCAHARTELGRADRGRPDGCAPAGSPSSASWSDSQGRVPEDDSEQSRGELPSWPPGEEPGESTGARSATPSNRAASSCVSRRDCHPPYGLFEPHFVGAPVALVYWSWDTFRCPSNRTTHVLQHRTHHLLLIRGGKCLVVGYHILNNRREIGQEALGGVSAAARGVNGRTLCLEQGTNGWRKAFMARAREAIGQGARAEPPGTGFEW